jgi:hypothetical protein
MLYPKIYAHTEGKLVEIPGLPAMYDYEFSPQTVWFIWANGAHIKRIYERLDRPWEAHPEDDKRRLHVKIFFFSVIRILFNFQQLFPWMWRGNGYYLLQLWIRLLGCNETMAFWHSERRTCFWTSATSWLWHRDPENRRRGKCWYRDISRGNAGTAWKTISFFCKIFFLPVILVSSDQFLLYYQISFGSIHWATAPEHIDELIDALIERKAPFVRGAAFHTIVYDSGSLFNQILSSASPLAKLSEQQTEKIKSSGLGLLTTWSPQQFILNHPVWYPYFNLSLRLLNTWKFIGNRMVCYAWRF